MTRVTTNSPDRERRAAELTAAGIPPDGTDDTAFGVAFVFCRRHLQAHATGWCAARNVEKVALVAGTHEAADVEAEGMRVAAVWGLAPAPKWPTPQMHPTARDDEMSRGGP